MTRDEHNDLMTADKARIITIILVNSLLSIYGFVLRLLFPWSQFITNNECFFDVLEYKIYEHRVFLESDFFFTENSRSELRIYSDP